MTDLDPYFSRIQSAFGRLIPTGVTGAESPTSPKTAMTLAEKDSFCREEKRAMGE